jgi:hypothetical protein
VERLDPQASNPSVILGCFGWLIAVVGLLAVLAGCVWAVVTGDWPEPLAGVVGIGAAVGLALVGLSAFVGQDPVTTTPAPSSEREEGPSRPPRP